MESFNQILAGSDIVIGTCTSNWTGLSNDARRAAYEKTLLDNFTLVTAENVMKPDATEPSRGVYKWNDNANQLINFAREHDTLRLKGHCLAWHNQLPDFFNELSPDAKRAGIRDHVGTVAAMMGGAGCVMIDVINECIDDSNAPALRSFWTGDLGLDADGAVAFLAELFRVARAQAPAARLCINDYSTTNWNAKSSFLFNLCDAIRKAGGPVDEVGFQSHQSVGDINPGFLGGMRANMARFKALGMTCNISELDILCDGLGGDDVSSDVAAAKAAAAAAPAWYDFFRAALEDRSVCNNVTLWGFDSTLSWLNDNHRRDRFPCSPWRTDSAGVLQETAIVGAIRRALRDVLNPPLAWQPFGCDVSTGWLTQIRSGGAWSGPQCHLPANTACAIQTRVVCASDVWLTLKSSDVDGSGWEFVSFKEQKIRDGAVTFHTTGKQYNVVYLEGPPLGTDFVVGPSFLNGQPMTWESTFPANGSLRAVTWARGREGAWAGLMVAPTANKTCTLTTKVYSSQPLKLTLQFWDFTKGQYGYATLAHADPAGGIAATFIVPGPAPDGTPARAYIESDQEGVEDYAAEAPKISLGGLEEMFAGGESRFQTASV